MCWRSTCGVRGHVLTPSAFINRLFGDRFELLTAFGSSGSLVLG
jgi:hypothetical protein